MLGAFFSCISLISLVCAIVQIARYFILKYKTKITYVKVILDKELNKSSEVYINLYDFKTGEKMPRFIEIDSTIKEYRLNKEFIVYVKPYELFIFSR